MWSVKVFVLNLGRLLEIENTWNYIWPPGVSGRRTRGLYSIISIYLLVGMCGNFKLFLVYRLQSLNEISLGKDDFHILKVINQ